MTNLKFLFIIFGALLYGQDKPNLITINYTEITNFGIFAETYSTLKVNDSKAVYTRKNIRYKKVSDDVKLEKHSDTLNQNKLPREVFYSDLNDGLIFLKDNSLEKNIIIKDSIINIDWKINSKPTDEIILGYKCNEASGEFRGRHYTVWFTTSIPVRYGPWKLHALPGLILKVEDNFNQITIQATQISQTKNEEIGDLILADFEKILTTKEHLLLIQNEEEKLLSEVMAKVQATMPRGATIANFEEENSDKNRFEISFEWETKKD